MWVVWLTAAMMGTGWVGLGDSLQNVPEEKLNFSLAMDPIMGLQSPTKDADAAESSALPSSAELISEQAKMTTMNLFEQSSTESASTGDISDLDDAASKESSTLTIPHELVTTETDSHTHSKSFQPSPPNGTLEAGLNSESRPSRLNSSQGPMNWTEAEISTLAPSRNQSQEPRNWTNANASVLAPGLNESHLLGTGTEADAAILAALLSGASNSSDWTEAEEANATILDQSTGSGNATTGNATSFTLLGRSLGPSNGNASATLATAPRNEPAQPANAAEPARFGGGYGWLEFMGWLNDSEVFLSPEWAVGEEETEPEPQEKSYATISPLTKMALLMSLFVGIAIAVGLGLIYCQDRRLRRQQYCPIQLEAADVNPAEMPPCIAPRRPSPPPLPPPPPPSRALPRRVSLPIPATVTPPPFSASSSSEHTEATLDSPTATTPSMVSVTQSPSSSSTSSTLKEASSASLTISIPSTSSENYESQA